MNFIVCVKKKCWKWILVFYSIESCLPLFKLVCKFHVHSLKRIIYRTTVQWTYQGTRYNHRLEKCHENNGGCDHQVAPNLIICKKSSCVCIMVTRFVTLNVVPWKKNKPQWFLLILNCDIFELLNYLIDRFLYYYLSILIELYIHIAYLLQTFDEKCHDILILHVIEI